MKNTQTIPGVDYQSLKTDLTGKTHAPNFEKARAFFLSLKPFISKNHIALLKHDIAADKQEIAKLQWELFQKKELVKNITFHQSHVVRKPLANILGMIELISNSKNELQNPAILEMISLLKISADELDKAIRQNSSINLP